MQRTAMTSNIQLPITLRPGRLKTVLLLITCLLFVLGGIWMGVEGKWVGFLCGAFFALGLPIFALQLHPKAAYLHLAPDGFTFCALFRAHTVHWGHVSEFAVIWIGPNRMVAWNFTRDCSPTGRARAISKSLSGYEAALPDTYGMKPQELVDLMESLRQRFVQTRSA
jgi:hypothetical protein